MCTLKRWLFVLASVLACTSTQEAREVRFKVVVSDDQGQHREGVTVDIDGQPVAISDSRGEAAVTFAARASRARISVRCPEQFLSPEPRSVPLSTHGRTPPLELAFVCKPLLRTLLLVVRAPLGIGLPVVVDGQQLGIVRWDGTFHAVLRRVPDSDVRVSLETGQAPKLSPQHPVREFKVADKDEILVFDQAFALSREKPRRVVERAQARPAGAKHIPYAIGGFRY